MIAVAERINGMFKDVKKAIQKKDAAVIQDLARKQTEAGAKFLDCNVGTAAADQQSAMQWLVEAIQSAVKTPIALDSQKIDVIKAGLAVCKNEVMINSCKADEDQLDKYMPLAVQHNASLVALTINAQGVPQNIDTRVEIAATIVSKAMEHGLPMDKLYIDPIILPVNCDQKQPDYLLQVMRQVKLLCDPPPHLIVGLSNISQGTSQRELINRVFLVMAMGAGLDAAILDVFDTEMMDDAITSDMLLNRMIYSDSFLKAARM
jgi:5-methyltetrahydrofolate corrinoid/iron sulfur protein methyltransferase